MTPKTTKPFLTIDEQLALLRSRGLDLNENHDGFDAAHVLRKEGYYSLINGYETPFLESKDTFKKGASLRDIQRLLLFDRALRMETFRVAIEAEALLRTAVAYCFAKDHQDQKEPYLDSSNYDPYYKEETEYVIDRFTNILYHRKKNGALELKNRYKQPYIAHYMKEYKEVPIWVLVNALALGDTISFFECLGEYLQRDVCEYISDYSGLEGTPTPAFTPSLIMRDYSLIRDFRNLCAHDERLYCARGGKAHNLTFFNFFWIITAYTSLPSAVDFSNNVLNLLNGLAKDMDVKFANKIMKKMGFNNQTKEQAKDKAEMNQKRIAKKAEE